MAVSKHDAMITVNCPVSEQFPQAGLYRPLTTTVRVMCPLLTVDNAEHRLAGEVSVAVPRDLALSDDDKRAIDIVGKVATGRYTFEGITFVDAPHHPADVSAHVIITNGHSNGPIPVADFMAADAALSAWTVDARPDGTPVYRLSPN